MCIRDRVEYDPEQVSLDALLLAYFYVIDPTVQNRQGNDRGSQYQTGVYYTNESARETAVSYTHLDVYKRQAVFCTKIAALNRWFTISECQYLNLHPVYLCSRNLNF